jgi:UDP-N-acetylmuramoylalanine--D-glutamate ligase
MRGYIAAKKLIFNNQQAGDFAVIGVDDEPCRLVYEEYKYKGLANVIGISASQPVEGGVYMHGGKLIDDTLYLKQEILDVSSIECLAGIHNAQNMAAAYAVARSFGLTPAMIIKAFQNFEGLPHRQERVGVVDRIAYINDSKATNVAAAAVALANYDPIFWIAGGRAKGDDILSLAPYFPRIKHAFLIGEAAPSFAAALQGHVPVTCADTLAIAVQKAREAALCHGGDKRVVLLSPACESLDQFDSFEHRGEIFRGLVLELPGYHEYKFSNGAPLKEKILC